MCLYNTLKYVISFNPCTSQSKNNDNNSYLTIHPPGRSCMVDSAKREEGFRNLWGIPDTSEPHVRAEGNGIPGSPCLSWVSHREKQHASYSAPHTPWGSWEANSPAVPYVPQVTFQPVNKANLTLQEHLMLPLYFCSRRKCSGMKKFSHWNPINSLIPLSIISSTLQI